MGKAAEPEKLAVIYAKAIFPKRPKLIYTKHVNPLLKLMNLLPKRCQCFVIKMLLTAS